MFSAKVFVLAGWKSNNTMMIFIVLSFTVKSHMQEFTGVIWMKVGQRQVASNSYTKLQTWLLSPPVGCYRPNIRLSLFVLGLNHKVDIHFTVPQGVEGWVDLGTAVPMYCTSTYLNCITCFDHVTKSHFAL